MIRIERVNLAAYSNRAMDRDHFLTTTTSTYSLGITTVELVLMLKSSIRYDDLQHGADGIVARGARSPADSAPKPNVRAVAGSKAVTFLSPGDNVAL